MRKLNICLDRACLIAFIKIRGNLSSILQGKPKSCVQYTISACSKIVKNDNNEADTKFIFIIEKTLICKAYYKINDY